MTIAVIGAGASGMAAALTAAEIPENRVLLFERQSRAGRKLAATGNGRCNLTNTEAAPCRYHGQDADFVRPALARFPVGDTLDFFKRFGLLTVREADGRVYPLSNSANSVVDVLRYALDAARVTLRAAEPVRAIRREGRGFLLTTDAAELQADRVIIAAGGAAGEKLGGGKDGYALLESLGHTRTALYPALAPITTENAYTRALKGIKADAALGLISEDETLARSEGEILFTESGVSGPAAFDLSRAAAVAGERKMTLEIDLMRDYSHEAVVQFLNARCAVLTRLPTSEILIGALQNRLARMVVKYAGLDADRPLSMLSHAEINALATACKHFRLPVRGTGGFSVAQVTAGGIKTAEFAPDTLESRIVPGLFASGEVLDVDGDCGGFNLQWAWSSGRLAGRLGQ